MVMNRQLLKEYINLIVYQALQEAGTSGGISSSGTSSTSSTGTTTGASSTETTKSTGGSSTDKDTESTISNIEDAVTANSELIVKNQKAINTAAHKMTSHTNNMISSTDKTATGLSNASKASNDLAKPEQNQDALTKAHTDQATGLGNASAGTKTTSDELKKTLTTLQTLDGQTKTGG